MAARRETMAPPTIPRPTPGDRYDPIADKWIPLSGEGGPLPRSDASAAWTGDELVVWGGVRGPVARRDGGRLHQDYALQSFVEFAFDAYGSRARRRKPGCAADGFGVSCCPYAWLSFASIACAD